MNFCEPSDKRQGRGYASKTVSRRVRRLLTAATLVGALMALVGVSAPGVLAAFTASTRASQTISVGRLHIDIDKTDGAPAPDPRAVNWAPVDVKWMPIDAPQIVISHTLDVRNDGTLRVGKMWLAVQPQPGLPPILMSDLTLTVAVSGPAGTQTETGTLASWQAARTDPALARVNPGQTVHFDLTLSGTVPHALLGLGPLQLRYLISATE